MGWLVLGFALIGISVWINIVSMDRAYLAHRQIGSYGQARALGTLSLIAATLGGLALGVALGMALAGGGT